MAVVEDVLCFCFHSGTFVLQNHTELVRRCGRGET